MKDVLRVLDVSKTYYGSKGRVLKKALTNITFTIEAGQLVLLVGESGSGKTTLLRICGTLLKPDSGAVEIADRRVSTMNGDELSNFRLNRIGFVFQDFNLLAGFTALENVEIVANLARKEGPAAVDRAKVALESAGVEKRQFKTLAAKLSGGEKQRVAIARAIVNEPPLIIADEPTGALSPHLRKGIVELLQDLASEGRAILVVTHDREIFGHVDDVLHLDEGKLVQDDRPSYKGALFDLDASGARYNIKDTSVLGRAHICDSTCERNHFDEPPTVQLDDSKRFISPHHALIYRTDEYWRIRDLGAKNHTAISTDGGKTFKVLPRGEEARIYDGDTIALAYAGPGCCSKGHKHAGPYRVLRFKEVYGD